MCELWEVLGCVGGVWGCVRLPTRALRHPSAAPLSTRLSGYVACYKKPLLLLGYRGAACLVKM